LNWSWFQSKDSSFFMLIAEFGESLASYSMSEIELSNSVPNTYGKELTVYWFLFGRPSSVSIPLFQIIDSHGLYIQKRGSLVFIENI
jgi:hypothetical protein